MTNVLSIVSYRFLPALMGGEKSISTFNNHLAKLVNLSCVTVKKAEVPPAAGYDILPLLSNSIIRYINPFYFFVVKKIILQKEITHIILEHPYYGWLGIALQKALGIKLVIHSHNIEALRFKSFGKWWWRLLWLYEKAVHRQADMNFFITREDMDYAIAHFKLKNDKCTVITYGTNFNTPPTPQEKMNARTSVCNTHHINPANLLLFYTGTLYYQPNVKGLDIIIDEINPLLQQNGIAYTILVCGNHLPERYNNLEFYKNKNIIYGGFVKDIDTYFKAADIFMNPISEGGGIKTKLVEALAGNSSAVSFASGAFGVPAEITGGKLIVVPDGDSAALFEAIQQSVALLKEDISTDFYEHFYWGNIVQKAYQHLLSMP
ncbi:glycosyltransferase family 4 protein [Agriterribacter sp.]|uniref:glycosyltransferase family 4 protein n=1 Tax=Agriterribacter sp. TaxID=2821509 RepID=UPI002C84B0EF|nr:glycosyltransferase family 4 protein [Agriterribacter sp.]HTN07636.1 glycosyltransferase family 4 protein [Agriterribacter sp.]